MSNKRTFRAIIEKGRGGGAFVTVPFDVEEVYGQKRVKIKSTIDGEPYRGSLVRMGGPSHVLGVLKALREKLDKTYGDEVTVVVEEDTEPRTVTIPPDLKRALKADPEAAAFFEELAYSHRREYVGWITEAKREETRHARVVKAVAMLKAKKKERGGG
jgi:hypothetical protein